MADLEVFIPPTQQGGARDMGKNRILTVILAVLVLAGGGAAGYFYWQFTLEQKQRMVKEQELAIARAEKEGMEQELRQTKQAKQQAEADLTKSKDQLSQTMDLLAQERKAKEDLAQSVEDRQHEIDRLSKDMEQLRQERETMVSQASQLKGQQSSLQSQVTELEKAKSDLESKVMELSQQPTVELDRVVVGQGGEGAAATASGEAAAMPASASHGQVLVVNREYDFIVVNMGKNQGLQIGQEFQVVRGEEVLGRVKVEKVYDELSAAAILPQSKKDAIREGDLVKAI